MCNRTVTVCKLHSTCTHPSWGGGGAVRRIGPVKYTGGLQYAGTANKNLYCSYTVQYSTVRVFCTIQLLLYCSNSYPLDGQITELSVSKTFFLAVHLRKMVG